MSTAFPLFLYVYDDKGMHDGGVDVPNELGLKVLMATAVAGAIAEKREVVITDREDFCVFHAKDGEILFPRPGARP